MYIYAWVLMKEANLVCTVFLTVFETYLHVIYADISICATYTYSIINYKCGLTLSWYDHMIIKVWNLNNEMI